MPWRDIQTIRAQAPLVHNITNYVVMNSTANTLLAIGASPVMAHALEEVQEMVRLSRALVINIGTLSPAWIEAMLHAGNEARRCGIPVVFDPVGSGATKYRTATAQKIIEVIQPTIIRGNASEIRSLLHSGQGTKGVDSVHSPDEVQEDAVELSRVAGCVVTVSGAVDLIAEGNRVIRVSNGHPIMSRITGMGCAASALTGAFAAVNPSPLFSAVHAMAVMGVAGEIAAERSIGPGSFALNFTDALYLLQESDFIQRLKIQ
jgi:hydroxyethylthiazole kinase